MCIRDSTDTAGNLIIGNANTLGRDSDEIEDAIAIGNNIILAGDFTLAIGDNAIVRSNNSTAIGETATAGTTRAAEIQMITICQLTMH